MTDLFIDIETVQDMEPDAYFEASEGVASGRITRESDSNLFWKIKKGALSPFDGKVVFIKYKIGDKGFVHHLKEWEEGEAAILGKIFGVISSLQSGTEKGTRIIGHNITKFDIPFLYERMRIHETSSKHILHLKMIRQPLIVDFLQLHLPLNSMTGKGLKHDVLAHAYGLPTKSTQGDLVSDQYFKRDYDKIVEYSEREFIYPELYAKIVSEGMVSKDRLAESIAWYDELHKDDPRPSF